jgi:hypothetical protein
MVAQIDKHQLTMVAFAMHPAGQLNRLADACFGQFPASMGAIGVHHHENLYRIQGLWYNGTMRKSQGFRYFLLLFIGSALLAGCKGGNWNFGGSDDETAPIAGDEHSSPIPKARGSYDSPDAQDMVIRHRITLPPL